MLKILLCLTSAHLDAIEKKEIDPNLVTYGFCYMVNLYRFHNMEPFKEKGEKDFYRLEFGKNLNGTGQIFGVLREPTVFELFKNMTLYSNIKHLGISFDFFMSEIFFLLHRFPQITSLAFEYYKLPFDFSWNVMGEHLQNLKALKNLKIETFYELTSNISWKRKDLSLILCACPKNLESLELDIVFKEDISSVLFRAFQDFPNLKRLKIRDRGKLAQNKTAISKLTKMINQREYARQEMLYTALLLRQKVGKMFRKEILGEILENAYLEVCYN